jgi:1-acyl-sn-glycerol-3-phosphate acyltransferase
LSGWRAPLRLAGVTLLTLVIVALVLLVNLVGLPFSGAICARPGATGSLVRRLDAAVLRAILGVQRLWCRGLLLLLGVRVRIVGPGPTEAALYVSNHLSYLDVAVIGSVAGCRFVAKREVAGWPVVGFLARLGRVMFVDRRRGKDLLRVGDEIRGTLAAGVPVVFFPEGTSSRGESVLPFHPGLLQPAAEAGLACRALTLHYETPDECRPPACTICWWGEMTFTPHVWELMKIARIDATLHFAPHTVCDTDRKRLASNLHAQVVSAFRPVRQEAADSGASLPASRPVSP